MFAYIKGTLEYKDNDYLVIEVNGVGYKIFTSLATIETSGKIGDEIKLYTYLHVREDVMCIYGFITRDELNMFELLITVSGVGPKAALSLLSSISPSRFALAIVTDDIQTLTKAQGIGKKTAQRMILELKDKIKKEQLSQSKGPNIDEIDLQNNSSRLSEAVSALMVLGYSGVEASRAVSKVFNEDMELEMIIKNSLKEMVKR